MTACRFPQKVVARHLADGEGKPFFWLGDTAWSLIHRTTAADLELYADTRARQRFNVSQIALLPELDGLRVPNPNGDLPLHDLDPTQPNEAWFRHADAAVSLLNERGIVACLLPTWGDKWNQRWGTGPEVFRKPAQARTYGKWLGERYAGAAVVWMLGGDRKCETDLHRQIIRAMAEGLQAGHGGRHLQTYHPSGSQTSVEAYGEDPDWLDFHCTQGGHTQVERSRATLARGLSQTPKPVLESEPAYEDHPRMADDWQSFDGYFTADEVRAQLYRAVLAGSPGVTYGCHPVWQMHDPEKHGGGKTHPRRSWRDALTLPLAERVHELREFFEALPWQELRPAGEDAAETSDGSVRVTFKSDGPSDSGIAGVIRR